MNSRAQTLSDGEDAVLQGRRSISMFGATAGSAVESFQAQ
jgi:hypothetical protein